jgi:hypothetical protein
MSSHWHEAFRRYACSWLLCAGFGLPRPQCQNMTAPTTSTSTTMSGGMNS